MVVVCPAVEETAALQVASGGSAALVERLQGEGRFQDAFAFAAAAGASSHRSEGARMPAAAVLANIKAGKAADGSTEGLRFNVSRHSGVHIHACLVHTCHKPCAEAGLECSMIAGEADQHSRGCMASFMAPASELTCSSGVAAMWRD